MRERIFDTFPGVKKKLTRIAYVTCKCRSESTGMGLFLQQRMKPAGFFFEPTSPRNNLKNAFLKPQCTQQPKISTWNAKLFYANNSGSPLNSLFLFHRLKTTHVSIAWTVSVAQPA